ncbi:hypothetical protein CHELA40_40080 [Chelatococcus asaccharovorans]|nr:hypothetical protein CHELA17_50114 [Chelatococcus asaccharovorans]CAH1689674.1 hypothetical protein CHELA40_40080 [Chelatococcus asaccharovorans]
MRRASASMRSGRATRTPEDMPGPTWSCRHPADDRLGAGRPEEAGGKVGRGGAWSGEDLVRARPASLGEGQPALKWAFLGPGPAFHDQPAGGVRYASVRPLSAAPSR